MARDVRSLSGPLGAGCGRRGKPSAVNKTARKTGPNRKSVSDLAPPKPRPHDALQPTRTVLQSLSVARERNSVVFLRRSAAASGASPQSGMVARAAAASWPSCRSRFPGQSSPCRSKVRQLEALPHVGRAPLHESFLGRDGRKSSAPCNGSSRADNAGNASAATSRSWSWRRNPAAWCRDDSRSAGPIAVVPTMCSKQPARVTTTVRDSPSGSTTSSASR